MMAVTIGETFAKSAHVCVRRNINESASTFILTSLESTAGFCNYTLTNTYKFKPTLSLPYSSLAASLASKVREPLL